MELWLAGSTILIACAFLALWHRIIIWRSRSKNHSAQDETIVEKDPYKAIEPLPDFDWSTTPPIKIRPFKPKYHMSMALENCPLSELITMDHTYLTRLHIRRTVMDQHRSATLQCNPVCSAAVLEFYDWTLRTYLPTRFPTMYQLNPNHLLNHATQIPIPLRPTTPLAALETLSANIDTDFLFLLPSSNTSSKIDGNSIGTPIYHLEAFATCFPAGFSTLSKLEQPLASIHTPVPGYASKLQKSMDRFFARLEVGKCVRRVNWSISTDDHLYSEGGNHLYAEDENKSSLAGGDGKVDGGGDSLQRQRDEVVVADCRLRCERQTLHRLPRTGALVFAFKTYLYPLSEVKEEGLGRVLAEAIDGLGGGSVPGMAFYKREVVWGEKVREYLLS